MRPRYGALYGALKIGRRRPKANQARSPDLARRQLIVVTGKGGVGKTAVVAALGDILASHGRSVLLVEADPRENLHHLLGVRPSGGDVVRAGPGLALKSASPRAILDGVVRQTLRLRPLSRRVLASPIYSHFADAAPGLKEMMLLGYALQVVEGEADHEADIVVLDAPASGHAVSLLAAPLLVAEVIGTGPLGAMAGRIARFVADPARCAVIVATHAAEMPVQETLETIEQLEQRLGRPPELVVVNALWPAVPETAGPSAPFDEGFELWAARRGVAARELERLCASWRGPTAELPLVASAFGPELVKALVGSLEPQLAREEAG